jgi:hypothetical protein
MEVRKRPDAVGFTMKQDSTPPRTSKLLAYFLRPFRFPFPGGRDPSTVDPNFSELSQRGRHNSRNALISPLCDCVHRVKAPQDHSATFELLHGTILFTRTQDAATDHKFWSRRYPHRESTCHFDRCLAVPATDLPTALEIIVKPGS